MEQVYKLWKMGTTSSSGILKTLYHMAVILLLGKRKITKFWNFMGIIPLNLK